MKQNTRPARSVEGSRDIVGLWVGEGGEGAKYWQQVLTELKNRGPLLLTCPPRVPAKLALVTAAALVYSATKGRGGTPHASADPSPSIWQDDRPRADTAPVETTSPAPSRPADFKIGDEARNGGAVVTVRETESINVAGAVKKAGDGAKYVILETVVFNDTKASMDLTCSLPIVNNLLDEQDRRYDTIDSWRRSAPR